MVLMKHKIASGEVVQIDRHVRRRQDLPETLYTLHLGILHEPLLSILLDEPFRTVLGLAASL